MMFVSRIIPYVSPSFGGPVFAMASMADSVSALGHSVSIHSIHRQSDGPVFDFSRKVKLSLHRDSTWGPLRHSPSLWASGDKLEFGVIHSHGLWTDVHRFAYELARRSNTPHILGPCGMLDSSALVRSRWKKKLVGKWFQFDALRNAACLLANSEHEYDDIRKFGLPNPVAVVPNPVPGPEREYVISNNYFHESSSVPLGKRVVLFLGRVHPVKGLSRLIHAWSILSSFHDSWHLVIAGPGEDSYLRLVKSLISTLGCADSVSVVGSLHGNEKWSALYSANLFIMPSDFENFGLSIAEALLAKLPVITTNRTPWVNLDKFRAGWCVDTTPDAIATALGEAMSLDDSVRQEVGSRGSDLVVSFSPDHVAKKLVALYRWLSGSDARPAFVRVD